MEEKELHEWDAERNENCTIQDPQMFLPEQHWELTFLYFCVLLFAGWLGITAECFEGIMSYCTLLIIMALVIFGLGRFASEDILRTNTKNILLLSIFFTLSVCIFHFFRLKIDPPTIM